MDERLKNLHAEWERHQRDADALKGQIGDLYEKIGEIGRKVSEIVSPYAPGDIVSVGDPAEGTPFVVTGYLPAMSPGEWTVEVRGINPEDGRLRSNARRDSFPMTAGWRPRKVGSFDLAANRILSIDEVFRANFLRGGRDAHGTENL